LVDFITRVVKDSFHVKMLHSVDAPADKVNKAIKQTYLEPTEAEKK